MHISIEKMDQFTNKINSLKDAGDWNKIIELILPELDKYPEEYWLITNLGVAYLNIGKLKEAKYYAEKAYSIAEEDYLVKYDYAYVLSFIKGNEMLAIKIFKEIISTNIEKLAFNPNGEGVKYAKSMINDSIFNIGEIYCELNEVSKGIKYFRLHLKKRQRGLYSNYSKKYVLSVYKANCKKLESTLD